MCLRMCVERVIAKIKVGLPPTGYDESLQDTYTVGRTLSHHTRFLEEVGLNGRTDNLGVFGARANFLGNRLRFRVIFELREENLSELCKSRRIVVHAKKRHGKVKRLCPGAKRLRAVLQRFSIQSTRRDVDVE